MNVPRFPATIIALALLLTATVATASLPSRPSGDRGSNFYLLVGAEGLDLDLDPRGSDEFVAAGLMPGEADGGLVIGVGWVFRRPLRLDLTATGWRLPTDLPEVDATLARAGAELHLAVFEGARGSLEATFSAAFLILSYTGMSQDEFLPGSSVGVGATGRLDLFGPLGLGVTYQYQQGRFQPKTFHLGDDDPFRVQPTARMHGVRVTIYVDL